MKIPEKTKEKKEKIKKKEKGKPKKEQVLIVAQEIKFARLLSGNEKKTRDKVLKTLKKWLLNCFEKQYEFKEDDFIRVWKGLFYAVWMSDKPLIQEELCESISAVLDLFPEEQLRHAMLMFKAGLRVLATEWYGLDQHRTDKFLMLVRRYLRASLRCLLRCQWSLHSCQMYANTLSGSDGIFALKTPSYARNALSMLLHIVDCYLEEIAKVSNGDIPDESLVELLRPLCSYMSAGEAPLLCAAARRLLTALVRQSDQGIHYQHATAAWLKMGCPEGGPEALELVSDEDDEEQVNGDEVSGDEDESSEKPLDPRAGRVNVELPCLPVPAALIADMLRDLLAGASSARHKRVKICLQRFEQLARDSYPLRVAPPAAPDLGAPPLHITYKKSARSLQALEKKLVAQSDDLALRGLSRKHRKRLLAKSRSGVSIVEDVDAMRQKLSTEVHNGGWQVEAAEPSPKKQKQSTDNKDNKKRKHNAKAVSDAKKRKVDAKHNGDVTQNGDATIKRPKLAKKDKAVKQKNVTKLEHNVVHKCKNIEKDKNKINLSPKTKDNKDKANKVTENGTQTDKVTNNNKTLEIKHKKQSGNNKKVYNTEKLLNANKKAKTSTTLPTEKKSVEKETTKHDKKAKNPTLLVNKVKQIQKQPKNDNFDSPKRVKFVLKNNSMQQPVDYYKSVRQSPNIPFDGTKQPSKTNLKPSTPSPINPFFKKKLKMKF